MGDASKSPARLVTSKTPHEKAWKPKLMQRLVDSVFGYDFFISYTWSDGRTYAKALAHRLKQDGFECFLDSDDYAKGDDWKRVGYWALLRTSRLVIVGTPNVHDSKPVLREVQIFPEFNRQIIPISVAGTLDPAKSQSPLFEFLDPDVLRIDESLYQLQLGPSNGAVSDLVTTFNLMRQTQKRIRFLGGATVVFAIVAALAVGFWRSSEIQKDAAIKSSTQSNVRRLLADGLRLHDEQPALALQHIVAARDRVAAPDLQVKAAIDQALSEMCAKGRVANIGKDVIRFRPNKDYSALVVGYYDGPAELWHVANATSVKIPGEGTMQCEFYGPNHGVFVVTQREGVSTSNVYRTEDGSLVGTLTSQPSTLVFSAGEELFLAKTSDGYPYNLWRTSDGKKLEMHGDANRIYFPSSRDGKYFLVTYYDEASGEIRLVENGSVAMALTKKAHLARMQPGCSFFVVQYGSSGGETELELRSNADGSVIPLDGKELKGVTFSASTRHPAKYALMRFADSSELWTFTDGSRAELERAVAGGEFSADPAARYFVARYPDSSAELFASATRSSLARFTSPVENLRFSSNPQASLLIVDLMDGPTQLWKCVGETAQRLDSLSDDVTFAFFSDDDDASYYCVEYKDQKRDVFATADDHLVTQIDSAVKRVTFRGGPESMLIVGETVSEGDTATSSELRVWRAADGKLIEPPDRRTVRSTPFLRGGEFFAAEDVSHVWRIHASADGREVANLGSSTFSGIPIRIVDHLHNDAFLFHPNKDRSQLWRIKSDSECVMLAGLDAFATDFRFLDPPKSRYFVLEFGNGRSEVWRRDGEVACRLLDLEVGVEDYVFHQDSGHLVVYYSYGKSFIVSVKWLDGVYSNGKMLPPGELIERVRKSPLASGFLPDREFAAYLQ